MQYSKQYDEYGNQLFKPVITNRYGINSDMDNFQVDTYLYKDAKDREARRKLREYEYNEARNFKMNASKLTYKSAEILYKKAVSNNISIVIIY